MGLFQLLAGLSESVVTNELLLLLVSSVIILLIGFVIGRILGKALLRLLKKIDFDKTIKKATGYDYSITNLSSKIVTYFIYFVTILIFLENLGITPFVLNVILVVVLIVLAISLILAIKDFIPNFVSGYSIRRKNLFSIGDKIKVGDVEGVIVKINLLDTHLETPKKDLMVIPNSYFVKNMVLKKNTKK